MGFENVVRPAVFPNIRPPDARAKAKPPADKGTAVLNSNPARSFDLSYSYSFNASSSSTNEIEREVDEVRVYQQTDDGTINRKNYIDLEIAKKIKKEGYEDDEGPPPDREKFEAEQKRLRNNYTLNDNYTPVTPSENVDVKGSKTIRRKDTQ